VLNEINYLTVKLLFLVSWKIKKFISLYSKNLNNIFYYNMLNEKQTWSVYIK